MAPIAPQIDIAPLDVVDPEPFFATAGDPEEEGDDNLFDDEDDLEIDEDDEEEDDEEEGDEDDEFEDEDKEDDDEDGDDDDVDEARSSASRADPGVYGDPAHGVPGASGDAAGDLEQRDGSKLSDDLSNEDEVALGGATRLPPD